jgi:tRNA threonylcarbamoyladenosine biosynthesis protein TsaE
VKLKIRTESAAETARLAAELKDKLTGKTVLLKGGLGAGKTTFVKAFAAASSCTGEGSSPTFTLMQRYSGETDIIHYDLYRLEHIAELENIGFFESVEEKGTKFIEWADKFGLENELENCVIIEINHTGGDAREINISVPEEI